MKPASSQDNLDYFTKAAFSALLEIRCEYDLRAGFEETREREAIGWLLWNIGRRG